MQILTSRQRNKEGYADLTAHQALKKAQRAESGDRPLVNIRPPCSGDSEANVALARELCAHAESVLIEAGFTLSGCCIWVKDSLVPGRSPYQWQHGPVLYGWKQGPSTSGSLTGNRPRSGTSPSHERTPATRPPSRWTCWRMEVVAGPFFVSRNRHAGGEIVVAQSLVSTDLDPLPGGVRRKYRRTTRES